MFNMNLTDNDDNNNNNAAYAWLYLNTDVWRKPENKTQRSALPIIGIHGVWLALNEPYPWHLWYPLVRSAGERKEKICKKSFKLGMRKSLLKMPQTHM